MFGAWKNEWEKMWRSRPGRRFQRRYLRRQKARSTGGARGRAGRLALGVALLAIGVVLIFIPGPAVLFLFVGAGSIASESQRAARFLDGSEVRLRRFWSGVRWRWGGMTPGSRAGVVCMLLGSVAAVLCMAWRLIVY